jgi:hypothetical protein
VEPEEAAMHRRAERVVRVFGDFASAEAARGFLDAEGIAAILLPASALEAALQPGRPHVELLVGAVDEARAREILPEAEITEEELERLALAGSGLPTPRQGEGGSRGPGSSQGRARWRR